MKFTMDGGMVYDFKDEEEAGGDMAELKALMGGWQGWGAWCGHKAELKGLMGGWARGKGGKVTGSEIRVSSGCIGRRCFARRSPTRSLSLVRRDDDYGRVPLHTRKALAGWTRLSACSTTAKQCTHSISPTCASPAAPHSPPSRLQLGGPAQARAQAHAQLQRGGVLQGGHEGRGGAQGRGGAARAQDARAARLPVLQREGWGCKPGLARGNRKSGEVVGKVREGVWGASTWQGGVRPLTCNLQYTTVVRSLQIGGCEEFISCGGADTAQIELYEKEHITAQHPSHKSLTPFSDVLMYVPPTALMTNKAFVLILFVWILQIPRITELYEKEHMYDLHRHGLAAKEAALRNQGASDEAVAEAVAPQPDDPQPLGEEEAAERERLLEEGFKDWTKRWGGGVRRGGVQGEG